jgi:hypothetical protein
MQQVTLNVTGPVPHTVTAHVGEMVSFSNPTNAPVTAKTIDGIWSIGPIPPGEVRDAHFQRAATYHYLTDQHPPHTGSVVVT